MKLYKLTDEKGRTYGGCQWGEGVTHTVSGEGELCGPGWIHAYTDPLLAVLLNPIHGNFPSDTMHLWECEGEVGKTDHGLKVGCTACTTVRQLDVPQVTAEQRVRFGLLCAMRVYTDPGWVVWAQGWLSGEDRTESAARAAASAARSAAWSAVDIDLTAIAAEAVR